MGAVGPEEAIATVALMPARENGGRRSLGWLILPMVPLVAVAALVGGPLPAALVVAACLQYAFLSPRAPERAAAIAAALTGPGRHAMSHATGTAGRAARAARRAARVALTRLLPAAVGCLALLVALDWGLGRAWDRVAGTPVDVPDALTLATAALPPAADERVGTPAMAGSPWAERYFAELAAVPFTYVPYVGPREVAVHGRYINSVDGVRASYQPPGADGAGAVDVWFFGGSTLWGEGQRDGHTIPSEVARLAEADGVTLRVSNFGVRGYTAFQEFLVFEQALARRDPPDLVVFYHGINEVYSLLESPSNMGSQPSIFQIDVTADAFHRAPPLPGQQPPPEPSVREAYLRTSVATRLLRAGGGLVAAPAGAEEPPYQPTPAALERATAESEQIYRRSVALIRHEARDHDVPTAMFWQPAGTEEVSSQYYADSERMAAIGGGIDISDALAHPPAPIYIDAVHTNELGARLSADAIWEHLVPMVDGASGP